MNVRKTALGLTVALLLPATASAEEVVLRVAHFVPPVAPMHSNVIEPWCDKLAAESEGQIKCQIYPAMQLGGTPPQLFSQARDGIADVVFTLPGYTPGRFPASEVFELPFIATSHDGSARAMWDFVQEHALYEFRGVKPLATWVNRHSVLHLRDREVKTLEDLEGLKIRAPSRLSNRLLGELGATAVGMPVPQMAESLAKGVIDGSLIPWEIVPATKTHELTRFHAESGAERALTAATMVIVMNERKYNSLSADLKAVVDANSGREFSAWVASQELTADAAGRELAVNNGNAVYTIPAEEMARWEAAAESVTENWIQETSVRGTDGQTLYNDAVALIEKYTSTP